MIDRVEMTGTRKCFAACALVLAVAWTLTAVARGAATERLHHPAPVSDLTFRPGTNALLSVAGAAITEWDHQAQISIRSLVVDSLHFSSLAVSRQGLWIAAGSRSGTVALLRDGLEGVRTTTIRPRESVLALTFLGSDSLLAVAAGNRLWSPGTRQRVRALGRHGDSEQIGPWVRSLAMSADGKLVASGSDDGMVLIWPAAGGADPTRVRVSDSAVSAVAFSADAGMLAAAGLRDVVVWTDPGSVVEEATWGSVKDRRRR